MKQKFGFIGAGNMARAIINGMTESHLIFSPQAVASDVSPEQLEALEQITQATLARDNADLVKSTDVVFFAVKPHQVGEVCDQIRPHIRPEQLFVSVCAGIPTSLVEQRLGGEVRVVRVMPNTPALIGCGSAAVAGGKNATREDVELVLQIFNAIGIAYELPEEKLDLMTGLTGSGPAYVFYFTEALISAGIELGLPEKAAGELVKQMVYGAARMAKESDQPLHELRQAVTTKGGTTEAGLRQLEEGDLRELIHNCVEAATRRSAEMSKGQ